MTPRDRYRRADQERRRRARAAAGYNNWFRVPETEPSPTRRALARLHALDGRSVQWMALRERLEARERETWEPEVPTRGRDTDTAAERRQMGISW